MEHEYSNNINEQQNKISNSSQGTISPLEITGNKNLQYSNISNYGYNTLNKSGIIECEIISSEDLLFTPDDDSIKPYYTPRNEIYSSDKFDSSPTPVNPEQAQLTKEPSSSSSSNLNSDNFSPSMTNSSYSDNFESIDGKQIDEGFFVTLDENKIRKVRAWDNYILGVVQKSTSFEQNPALIEVIFCGKAIVKDDGTCLANGYCLPNSNGIATTWHYGYRVLKRISSNEILIFIK